MVLESSVIDSGHPAHEPWALGYGDARGVLGRCEEPEPAERG